MNELHPNGKIVSASGGTLDYVGEDGEILFSVSVPPGIRLAREYLDLAPPGVIVQIAQGDLVHLPPKSWAGIQGQDHVESGANPDFQPSSADRLQRQMRLQMAQIQADNKRIDARIAALAAIDRIPTAPAVNRQAASEDASPVVE